MRKLLKELVFADGPPGREIEVQEIVTRELRPIVDSLEVDSWGNVIGRRKGTSEKSLMLIAHQDEDWALLTTHIDDDGFVRFTRLVGHRWNLLGQRVSIHGRKSKVPGVVGLPAPHLIPVPQQQRGYKPRFEEMFIDCGAGTKEEATELGLEVGQFVTGYKHFGDLAKGRLIGNCFDNRAGVTMMIEIMRQVQKQELAMNLVAVASVQEELGARGARPAAFALEPDFAIALDVSPTGDHPNIKTDLVPVSLGKGPALLEADQSHVTAPALNSWLRRVAKTHNLPLQAVALRKPINFGTDAAAVELVKKGCQATALLLPTRYFHTTNSVIDYVDMETTVQLMVHCIQTLNELGAASR
jgi:endoglucanase